MKQSVDHHTGVGQRATKAGAKQLGFKIFFLKADFFQNLNFTIRLCSTCKICNLGSINKKRLFGEREITKVLGSSSRRCVS
jgi:hypothetical protein